LIKKAPLLKINFNSFEN